MKTTATMAAALVLVLAGCGGSGQMPTAAEAPPNAGPQTEEVLRSKIVTGVGEDFRGGTHAGPKGYGICIRTGIGRALDRATLRRLLTVSRRPRGGAYAAQALNAIAAPIGDACGGRRFVPELVHAAAALRGARLVDSRAHRLGLEYGPYLGFSCPRPSRRACDRIGIDLVLRRQARSVAAVVAGRRVQLVTPGPVPHDADAVGRDWGGFLENAGVRREGDSAYLPVRVAIVYPGGRRETLRMPPVRVSPGFG
jgi:predicted small lipoprotein YifL